MSKFIYPNSGILRGIVLLLTLGISGIILALPSVISNLGEHYHSALNIIMLVSISGYVYGLGFTFKLMVWKVLFSPILSISLMTIIIGSFV